MIDAIIIVKKKTDIIRQDYVTLDCPGNGTVTPGRETEGERNRRARDYDFGNRLNRYKEIGKLDIFA